MADRFPSIEDIDAGETDVRSSDAPKGDFLSRERQMLGDDAEFFTTNDLKQATIEDAEDDLLGGDDDFGAPQTSTTADELTDFESSFPAVNTQNDNVGPGGTITSQAPGYTNYNPQSQNQDDSAAISSWRSKRDTDLSRRDEASSRKKTRNNSHSPKGYRLVLRIVQPQGRPSEGPDRERCRGISGQARGYHGRRYELGADRKVG